MNRILYPLAFLAVLAACSSEPPEVPEVPVETPDALIEISGDTSVLGPPEVYLDPSRGVICYRVYYGVSCLPCQDLYPGACPEESTP